MSSPFRQFDAELLGDAAVEVGRGRVARALT